MHKNVFALFSLLALVVACDAGPADVMRSNPHYRASLDAIFDDPCAREIAKDSLSSRLKKLGNKHPCIEKINYRGMDGLTPLFWGLRHEDIEAIKVMLDLGANPDVELSGNFKPNSYVSNAILKHNNQILKLLLAAGADPGKHTNNGRWSAWSAVKVKNYEGLHVLLDHGLSPNVSDEFGNTVLSAAIASGVYRAAYILLEAGADPMIASERGVSALDFMKDGGCRAPESQKEWCFRVFEKVEEEYGIELDSTPRWQNVR